jgi:hypothetical protein
VWVESGSLDVEVAEGSVELAWQPPGLVAEQPEHGEDERHSHHEGVYEDTYTKTEGDGLQGGVGGSDEAGEDGRT